MYKLGPILALRYLVCVKNKPMGDKPWPMDKLSTGFCYECIDERGTKGVRKGYESGRGCTKGATKGLRQGALS